jgi:hypothetical protein
MKISFGSTEEGGIILKKFEINRAWIGFHLLQDRVHWQDFMNILMNLQCP